MYKNKTLISVSKCKLKFNKFQFINMDIYLGIFIPCFDVDLFY